MNSEIVDDESNIEINLDNKNFEYISVEMDIILITNGRILYLVSNYYFLKIPNDFKTWKNVELD